MTFAWDDGTVAHVPIGAVGVTAEELSDALGDVFASEKIEKVAHGGRALTLGLSLFGITLRGMCLDAHIGAYLLDPGAPAYSLEEVARKYSGRELKAVGAEERPAA